MFEFLTNNPNNAIGLLKQDHNDLKDLFDRFEKTEDHAEKAKIAKEALNILKIHAVIEEEIFYPALDGKIDSKVLDEADEEHHVAKMLVAELDQLGPAADRFAAKFKVLAESVRHHIKEEEHVLMPQAEDAQVDLAELGQQMQARRKQLETSGIPQSHEEMMLLAAKNARKPKVRKAKTAKGHVAHPPAQKPHASLH